MANPFTTIPTVNKNTPSKPRGTGFTNIQRILSANTGNRLGSTVAGQVGQLSSQARTGLQEATQGFQTQLGQARQGLEEKKGQAGQIMTKLDTAPSAIGEQEVEQFKTIGTSEYGGPKGLSNADELRRRGSEVQALGQLSGSQAGRQELLNRFIGRPGYTTGQRTLDTILFGQDAAPELRQIRRESRDLPQKVDIEAARSMAQAGEEAGALNRFKQDFYNQLYGQEGKQSQITSDIQSQQQAALEKAKTDENINNVVLNSLLSGDTSKLKNISNSYFGSDLASISKILPYLNEGTRNALANRLVGAKTATGAGDVATDLQRAQMVALSKLKGETPDIMYTNPRITGTTGGFKDINQISGDLTSDIKRNTAIEALKQVFGDQYKNYTPEKQLALAQSYKDEFDKSLLDLAKYGPTSNLSYAPYISNLLKQYNISKPEDLVNAYYTNPELQKEIMAKPYSNFDPRVGGGYDNPLGKLATLYGTSSVNTLNALQPLLQKYSKYNLLPG
jgi:hypothetical protein